MMIHDNDIQHYLNTVRHSSPIDVITVCPNCAVPIVVRSTHLEEDIKYYAESCSRSSGKGDGK